MSDTIAPPRQKLSREHIALRLLNLRLQYGAIIRQYNAFNAGMQDTCIDCGWTIQVGQRIVGAYWAFRPISGFYAHTECTPISDSRWLNDDDLTDIFGFGDYKNQKCKAHNEQVTHRTFIGEFVRYVCNKCVIEKSQRE